MSYQAQTRRTKSLTSISNANRSIRVPTGSKPRTACSQELKPKPDVRTDFQRSRPATSTKASAAFYRPSPLYSHASEAHIHRIRCATAKSEFKEQFKATPPAPASSRTDLRWSESQTQLHESRPRTNQLPAIAEEDEDDTESIDWTAPLDITSYFYKPEYIIQPSIEFQTELLEEGDDMAKEAAKGTNVEAINSDVQKETMISRQNASGEDEEGGNEPLINPEPIESVADDNANENDIPAQVKGRSRSKSSLYGREIPDYFAFIKELNNEIRELNLETKRMENYSPRTKKQEETRKETIARGLATLKRIYELNPELTEFAAKKHICGPPGNHWIGLSRVEVMEVMKRIRREFGAPPRNYRSYFPNRANPFRKNSKNSKKKNGKSHSRKTQTPKDEHQPRCSKPSTPKLRASQLPLQQHVPGPKHLHTNICIRPWEPTWDGWSQDQEEDEGDDSELHDYLANDANLPNTKRSSSLTQFDIGEMEQWLDSVPEGGQEAMPMNNESDYAAGEQDQSDDGDLNDDFITLEIFNPTFPTYRVNH